MNNIHQHIVYPLVVLGVAGLCGLVIKLLKDRRDLDKQLQVKEDEQQDAKMQGLEKLIKMQSEHMANAVVQMKVVTDELKGQLIAVKDDIRKEMEVCASDLRQQVGVAHKRISNLSDDFNILKGEHIAFHNSEPINHRKNVGRREVDHLSNILLAEKTDCCGDDL